MHEHMASKSTIESESEIIEKKTYKFRDGKM